MEINQHELITDIHFVKISTILFPLRFVPLSVLRTAILAGFLISAVFSCSFSEAKETGYVSSLSMPVGTTPISRAGAVYYDARQNEIYVSDLANLRNVKCFIHF